MCLNTVLYADDQIIIQESKGNPQILIYIIGKLTSEHNMEISRVSTEMMSLEGTTISIQR